MNRDLFEGQWHELKGRIRQQWGRLTENDLEFIAGKREALLGKLQERYGWARAEAQDALRQWKETSQVEH